MAYTSKYTGASIESLLGTIKTHTSATNPHAVTKAQIGLGNVSRYAQVKRSQIGAANGVVPLDANGKIAKSYLPESYQIIEYVAVDLQLPSGTIWADRNVGASTESDYGQYFQWGDIIGHTSVDKRFNFANYKWCNGKYNTLTKYNTSSSYGTVDKKTTLEESDDAATQNMDSDWRMPDTTHFNELLNTSNCTSSVVTKNGHSGILFTSVRNGKTLFFPRAGCMYGSSLSDVGNIINVWSRNVSQSEPSYASVFHGTSMDTDERCSGFSVRGIK